MGFNYTQLTKTIETIRQYSNDHQTPILIAIDGGSGSGKSTVAAYIAAELSAALIEIDSFFRGDILDHKWDEFDIKAKLNNVFDWERLRKDVLNPLLQGREGKWQQLDFEQGIQPDGTYKLHKDYTTIEPSQVIILEGAYSAGPKLQDIVDISVLVDVDKETRHKRLSDREPSEFLEVWHRRWDEVESAYFNEYMPSSSFDIVVHWI